MFNLYASSSLPTISVPFGRIAAMAASGTISGVIKCDDVKTGSRLNTSDTKGQTAAETTTSAEKGCDVGRLSTAEPEIDELDTDTEGEWRLQHRNEERCSCPNDINVSASEADAIHASVECAAAQRQPTGCTVASSPEVTGSGAEKAIGLKFGIDQILVKKSNESKRNTVPG